LKQQTLIIVLVVMCVKNFQISAPGVLQTPKRNCWVLMIGCLYQVYSSNATISGNGSYFEG